MEEIEIIRLHSSQQRQAADMLARAFFEDPLMVLLFPDPLLRQKYLPYLMLGTIRYCLLFGEVYTTPDLAGVAGWLPPGQTETRPLGLVRANLGVIPLAMGWHVFPHVRRTIPVIDRKHKELLPAPHWYLLVLGVDPARQGKGIGSRLIQPRLDAAQANGLPCYLETMTEVDANFYQKRGFAVVHETTIPPKDLHVWMMIRK